MIIIVCNLKCNHKNNNNKTKFWYKPHVFTINAARKIFKK